MHICSNYHVSHHFFCADNLGYRHISLKNVTELADREVLSSSVKVDAVMQKETKFWKSLEDSVRYDDIITQKETKFCKSLEDSVQYDDVITQREIELYKSPEEFVQYDDAIAQREASLYETFEDPNQHNDVVTQSRVSWLYRSLEASINSSSQQSDRGSKESTLDSDKYEKTDSQSEPHKLLQMSQSQLTNSQEVHSLHRHLYEFEYSGSLGRSFNAESSHEVVN